MKRKYFGITYPTFLCHDLFLLFWKRFLCKRNIHIFDEVLGTGHYLVCDACQLMVHIEKISTEYVPEDVLKAIIFEE